MFCVMQITAVSFDKRIARSVSATISELAFIII